MKVKRILTILIVTLVFMIMIPAVYADDVAPVDVSAMPVDNGGVSGGDVSLVAENGGGDTAETEPAPGGETVNSDAGQNLSNKETLVEPVAVHVDNAEEHLNVVVVERQQNENNTPAENTQDVNVQVDVTVRVDGTVTDIYGDGQVDVTVREKADDVVVVEIQQDENNTPAENTQDVNVQADVGDGVYVTVDVTVDDDLVDVTIQGNADISVAEIVGTGKKYDTLQEALNAVEDGQTIQLLRDVDLGTDSLSSVIGRYILDLNGRKISQNGNSNGIFIGSESSVTIVDGTTDKNGTIYFTNDVSHSGKIGIAVSGELTFNSGNILAEATVPNADVYCISCLDTGKVTINDGNFQAKAQNCAFAVEVSGETVINGGKFASYSENNCGDTIIYSYDSANLKITGGDFIAVSEEYSSQVLNCFYSEDEPKKLSSVEISGGNFSSDGAVANVRGVWTITGGNFSGIEVLDITKGSIVTVSGGTFKSENEDGVATCVVNDGDLTITGGNFTSQTGKSSAGCLVNNGNLIIADGTFIARGMNGLAQCIENRDALTISGGEFLAESDTNSSVLKNYNYGTIATYLIDDGYFNAVTEKSNGEAITIDASRNSSGIINGGTFEASAGQAYVLFANDIVINGGNFMANCPFNREDTNYAYVAEDGIISNATICGGNFAAAVNKSNSAAISIGFNTGDNVVLSGSTSINAETDILAFGDLDFSDWSGNTKDSNIVVAYGEATKTLGYDVPKIRGDMSKFNAITSSLSGGVYTTKPSDLSITPDENGNERTSVKNTDEETYSEGYLYMLGVKEKELPVILPYDYNDSPAKITLKVYVDNVLIDSSYYRIVWNPDGNPAVIFTNEYLSTLSSGTYTVRVELSNGTNYSYQMSVDQAPVTEEGEKMAQVA